MLHYCFAALQAVVKKHYDKIQVVPDLREALNITSDSQERYVTDPTADIRKMITAMDQYAEAVGVRALRHFQGATPITAFADLQSAARTAQARLDSSSSNNGKTLRVLLELEMVADYLPCRAMFRAGHDGDWRRLIASFIQIGPLLFEAERPKKSEEWLSHMLRFARMSSREWFLVSRRCLFHRYYDGAAVLDVTPDYDAFGASVSPIRYVLNDENGEDFVGRMKTSGAYTVAALMRRSKLFNYFERLRSHNRRKRHKSSSGCMIQEQWYLTCIFNICRALEQRPADRKVSPHGAGGRAQRLIGVVLDARKHCRRKPIDHVQSRRTEVCYRQIVADLRASSEKEGHDAGSAVDYISKGCKHGILRRPKDGVPGEGSVVEWPRAFLQDITHAITRVGISCSAKSIDFAHFGPVLAPAVKAYVKKARLKYYSQAVLPPNFDEAFLHHTPLGVSTTFGVERRSDLRPAQVHRRQMDAWAEAEAEAEVEAGEAEPIAQSLASRRSRRAAPRAQRGAQ
jgi:hypothetical protein